MVARKRGAKRKPKKKRTVGRPKFEPTEKQRGEVRAFVIAGYRQADIAQQLGVDEKTLRLHFRDELTRAEAMMIAGVAQTVAQMAMGRAAVVDQGQIVRQELVPSLGACCFILKTRGKKQGWSERIEVTGADGRSLFEDFDLTRLTNAEFEQLQKLLRKCGASLPDFGGDGTTET